MSLDANGPGTQTMRRNRPGGSAAAAADTTQVGVPMRQPRPAYPPGHPRRARIRTILQPLGSTRVRVNFESREARYAALSYGLEPVRHQLAKVDADELRAVAVAVIQAALPTRPTQEGKRGRLV